MVVVFGNFLYHKFPCVVSGVGMLPTSLVSR